MCFALAGCSAQLGVGIAVLSLAAPRWFGCWFASRPALCIAAVVLLFLLCHRGHVRVRVAVRVGAPVPISCCSAVSCCSTEDNDDSVESWFWREMTYLGSWGVVLGRMLSTVISGKWRAFVAGCSAVSCVASVGSFERFDAAAAVVCAAVFSLCFCCTAAAAELSVPDAAAPAVVLSCVFMVVVFFVLWARAFW